MGIDMCTAHDVEICYDDNECCPLCDAEGEMSELRDQVHQLELKAEDQSDYNYLQDQVETLEGQLDEMQSDKDELEEERDDLAAKLAELKEETTDTLAEY